MKMLMLHLVCAFIAAAESTALNASQLDGKINFGECLNEGEVVAFLANLMYNLAIYCTATLITPFDLITTATCASKTTDNIQSPYHIFPTAILERKPYEIEYAIAHDRYRMNNPVKNQMFNLGHIKLRIDLGTEDFHKLKTMYIHREESQINIVGQNPTLYGWSSSSYILDVPDQIKKKMTVVIQERAVCERYNPQSYPSYTEESQMCGEPTGEHQNLSKEDSGCPLVYGGKLVGVTMHKKRSKTLNPILFFLRVHDLGRPFPGIAKKDYYERLLASPCLPDLNA